MTIFDGTTDKELSYATIAQGAYEAASQSE